MQVKHQTAWMRVGMFWPVALMIPHDGQVYKSSTPAFHGIQSSMSQDVCLPHAQIKPEGGI
jgi:hypothetical protein